MQDALDVVVNVIRHNTYGDCLNIQVCSDDGSLLLTIETAYGVLDPEIVGGIHLMYPNAFINVVKEFGGEIYNKDDRVSYQNVVYAANLIINGE